MTFMRSALSVVITAVLLSVPVAAQEAAKSPSHSDASAAITAASSATGVRFVAPGAARRVRLEVYAPSGERLFDSGFRAGNILDWDGQTLPDGSYLCVFTAEPLQGTPTRRLAGVNVQGGRAALSTEDEGQLNSSYAQAVAAAGLQQDEASAAARAQKANAVTVTAHDGTDGQVTSTSGSLTFRTGDLFSGQEREQMRVTPEGHVGIGTTTPEDTLDVAGTIRARGGIRFDDGTVLTSAKGAGSAGLSLVPSNGAADTAPGPSLAGTGTANKLTKWMDGAGTLGDSVIAESNGFVGIGTAAPTTPLDVVYNDNNFGFGFNIKNSNTGTQALTGYGINNSAGGRVGQFVFVPSNYTNAALRDTLLFSSAGPTTALGFVSSADGAGKPDIFFRAGTGPDNIRIKGTTGLVGIGTSAPTERLEVAGNLRVSGAGNGIIFPDGSKMTTAASAGGGSMTGTGIVSAINDAATTGTINDNRLSANVARLDAANAWVGNNTFNGGSLTVDNNTLFVNPVTHRVGVGTASPEQSLSVNGALNIDQGSANAGNLITPALTFGSGSGEGIASKRNTGGNQYGLDFYTNGVNRLSITNGGRVGIGTNAPGAKLDILGGAAPDGSSDPIALAFEYSGGGYRHFIRTRHNNVIGSGNAIDFYVNNSSQSAGSSAPGVGNVHALTLDSGRVGIGTTAPAYKLHAVGAGNVLRVESSNATGTLASFGGTGEFSIDAPNVPAGRFFVANNGNVGIGVAAPTDKLDVAGDAAIVGTLKANGALITGDMTTRGTVSAYTYSFPDGTTQITAVGATFTAMRQNSVEIAPNGQAQASVAHIDAANGSFELTATFRLTNAANLAFQTNTRGVTCTLGGDSYSFTLPAAAEVGATQVFTIHSVAVLGTAVGIDLTCGATSGGTDRSYVYVTQRRLTATRVNNIVVQ